MTRAGAAPVEARRRMCICGRPAGAGECGCGASRRGDLAPGQRRVGGADRRIARSPGEPRQARSWATSAGQPMRGRVPSDPQPRWGSEGEAVPGRLGDDPKAPLGAPLRELTEYILCEVQTLGVSPVFAGFPWGSRAFCAYASPSAPRRARSFLIRPPTVVSVPNASSLLPRDQRPHVDPSPRRPLRRTLPGCQGATPPGTVGPQTRRPPGGVGGTIRG
jgi:hypothetical protein